MKYRILNDDNNVVSRCHAATEAGMASALPDGDITGYHIHPDDIQEYKKDLVRAEASRRLQVLFGVKNSDQLNVKISNASREAIKLLEIGKSNWTPEQALRSAELKSANDAIDAIRTASNILEAMDPLPDDYQDNARWP